MIKLLTPLGLGALLVASPAAANHIFNLDTPFASRGECEAETASLDNEDADSLVDRFPGLFSTTGEARSFIGRAFTCELNDGDGQWYITDHRQQVLDSDWFQRR